MPDGHLVIELGRYLVGEAGIYVAQVVDRKVSRGQTYLVVDGGSTITFRHPATSGRSSARITRSPSATG
jgi:diaminopimelate decarboxylase